MGKRTWIDSGIWSDTDDLSDMDKLLYLYLLTNEQRNLAGYYRLNMGYMSLDLGVIETRLAKMLKREQKYWIYDPDTQQILIPKFTKYNVIKSKQQYVRLNAELNALKPCKLHKMFIKAFVEVNGIGADELIDEKFRRIAETIT